MAISTVEISTLHKQVKGMLVALSAQFVLGMVVNLYAVPPEDPGFTTESIFVKLSFFAHSLLGLVILVGSIVLLILSRKSGKVEWKKAGTLGFLSVLLAAGAGIATVALSGDVTELTSFIMAIGFLFSVLAYGSYYLKLRE